MKLYIDTATHNKIVIGINDKRFEAITKEKSSQQLLPFIHETLMKNKFKLDDINEIEVNTGPGSFTGLRVGVAVANALGWALNVEVNVKKAGGAIEINY